MSMHPGLRREQQEDAIGFQGLIMQPAMAAKADIASSSNFPALVVSDGLGGHAGGEVASRIAAEVLSKGWNPGSDPQEMVDEAHQAISKAGEETSLQGMGATVAMLVLESEDLLLLNVGDSSIFEITSELLKLSEDDAIADQQSPALSQALGVGVQVRPHLRRLPIEDGVSFLLCSDGLTSAVPEEEIAALVASPSDQAKTAAGLLDAALSAGGPDNISLAVVRVEDPGNLNDTGEDEPRALQTRTI